MTSNADARRENARQSDGKFGQQEHAEPSTTDLQRQRWADEDERRRRATAWLDDERYLYDDMTDASTEFLAEANAINDLWGSVSFGLTPDMALVRLENPELVLGDLWRHSSGENARAQMLAGLETGRKRFADFVEENDLHDPPKPTIENPTAHEFTSTTTAYDESQWRDDIKDGDLLVVTNDDGSKTIGFLKEAWPIVLHGPKGHFHDFKHDRDAFLSQFPEYEQVFAEADRLA